MSRDTVSLAHLGPKARAQANAQIGASKKPEAKPSKYMAKKCEADGIKFDSLRERARYCELKLLQRAGKISGLECHPRFPIYVNGFYVTRYTPDFRYFSPQHGDVIEDVKSGPTMTRASAIAIKLFQACYSPHKVVIVK